MRGAVSSILARRPAQRLILAVAPFLIVFGLFELQALFGVLRYADPLARYVFLAVVAAIVFGTLNHKGKLKTRSISSLSIQDSRTASVAAASTIAALCLLALLINWSNGGTRDVSAIGGVLPYSDATGYFEGAERLVFSQQLTQWTERRPLNAAFLAARLILTKNNFFGALFLQALLASFALFLATRALFQTHGKTAALWFFAFTFAFVSCCLHRTLSEPLGISLGLFALALLWSGIANRSLASYALGTFVLSLALLARAGAMFALPACVLFAAFFFSGSWSKRLAGVLITLAAIGAAWFINQTIIRLYGTADGTLLSNFSYVIYGLSQGGTSWTQALTDFPQLTASGEAKAASFLYQKAAEAILTKPYLLLWGLIKSFMLGIASFPPHVLRLIADGSDGGSPWSLVHLAVAGAFLVPAMALGAFKFMKGRWAKLDRFDFFLIVQLLAFFASLPFFYLDGGIRLTAATFAVLAVTMALILSTLTPSKQFAENVAVSKTVGIAATAAVVVVVLASLLAPKFNYLIEPAPMETAGTCRAGEERLVVRVGDGSTHINILNDRNQPSVGPDIRHADFSISESNEGKQDWKSLSTPATILLAFDVRSQSLRQIVGPAGFANGPQRWASLCATPLRGQAFTHRIVP